MAKKSTTNKIGRPKKSIDYVKVEKLASLFCTQQDIANVLELSVRKLQYDDKFMRIYKRGLENAKTNLRVAQYKSATGGNVTMQIFLGKNYLDQRDIKDIQVGERLIDTAREVAEALKSAYDTSDETPE